MRWPFASVTSTTTSCGLTEEVILFQDRMNGVLEVNLASVSNRLNQIMKVLTVMSTIFLPLTVLTGMWGMNIDLPHLPGGPGRSSGGSAASWLQSA